MSAAENKSDILVKLEAALETFDRVLLVTDDLQEPFITSSMKKILVLTTKNIPLADIPQITYSQITAKQQTELLKLYGMYEFSDRFQVIAADGRFGSLWNYVETGILTAQEAMEVLLR